MFYSSNKDDQLLIGRKILGVGRLGQDSVVFATDEGEIQLQFEGDCCSSAYVYDLIGDIVGETVTEVQLDVRDDQPEEESVITKLKNLFGADCLQESQSIWSVDILAGGKKLRVMHCNSSNGYYDSYTRFSKLS